MKYWSYLLAKLSAAALFLFGVWTLLNWLLPEPPTVLRYRLSRFPQDLRWTSALLAFWLLSAAILYFVVWDQRRRCRTCLTLLRMPLNKGSWSQGSIFAPPHTESICPYGHGTRQQPEVHLESSDPPAWKRHDDNIWRELEELDKRK